MTDSHRAPDTAGDAPPESLAGVPQGEEPRAARPPSPADPGAISATRAGTVALVGRPNVGKSTLLNAMMGTKIAATTHKPQTTRRQLRGVLTRDDTQFVFVDTPGLIRRASGLDAFMLEEALDAVRDVDVVVLLAEAYLSKDEQGQSVAAIDRRDDETLRTLEESAGSGQTLVLVLSKLDRLPERSMVLPLIGEWGHKRDFHAIVPVSAVKGDGIDVLLDVLGKLMPESPFLFPDETLTDASERDIAAELIREKAMLELADELPYKVAVQVEDFDESRREDPRKPLIRIQAVLHVERESQKRIVVGKGGERIKAIGMRARKDLEYLLGAQVMLQLFVHVEADWTSTDKGLRKVGYVPRK